MTEEQDSNGTVVSLVRGGFLVVLLVVVGAVVYGLSSQWAATEYVENPGSYTRQMTEAERNMREVERALSEYRRERGEYPAELRKLVETGFLEEWPRLTRTAPERDQPVATLDEFEPYALVYQPERTERGVRGYRLILLGANRAQGADADGDGEPDGAVTIVSDSQ